MVVSVGTAEQIFHKAGRRVTAKREHCPRNRSYIFRVYRADPGASKILVDSTTSLQQTPQETAGAWVLAFAQRVCQLQQRRRVLTFTQGFKVRQQVGVFIQTRFEDANGVAYDLRMRIAKATTNGIP